MKIKIDKKIVDYKVSRDQEQVQQPATRTGIQELSDNREKMLDLIEEYSPMSHVSKDDPPVAMFYGGAKPVKGDEPRDPTHSALLGVMLEEKLKAAGIEVVLVCPGRTDKRYANAAQFLIGRLRE